MDATIALGRREEGLEVDLELQALQGRQKRNVRQPRGEMLFEQGGHACACGSAPGDVAPIGQDTINIKKDDFYIFCTLQVRWLKPCLRRHRHTVILLLDDFGTHQVVGIERADQAAIAINHQ